ncbi:nucleotidyl transferase AbiEii/AbiGii toxin family protein [Desulfobacula sp.]|uniref:nucleotidyl transferase AbiEii/AbiGii toxin family protein n=1 Tax=Desulfobacula sp. TaxID=2593537 RepID=UPI00262954B0|nr:nucleotidyl transferase AbiEii/AbiGii toxin family protein [Desulfobacula sp.]
MLSILPIVGQEKNFALKGGTALNFFHLNMPRLSVDIDLTFLPVKPRDATLKDITKSLSRISDKVKRLFSRCQIQKLKIKDTDYTYKLIIKSQGSLVKIEPNLILRGSCYPPILKPLCKNAGDIFKMEMEVPVLSFADLYGGKICAALDRQHPRDLFDIKLLSEAGGLNEEISQAFVVYLASHNRPMSELLSPNFQAFRQAYETDFKGMSSIEVSYQELGKIRKELPSLILSKLSRNERKFLLSVKMGIPDFSLLSISGLENLPAIKWKIENILRMESKKRIAATEKLKSILDLS